MHSKYGCHQLRLGPSEDYVCLALKQFPLQGPSSALTSALRAGSLKDTAQSAPQPPKPSTAGTALAAAGQKEPSTNDCSKAALPAGITATQRAPSFNTWTEDDA